MRQGIKLVVQDTRNVLLIHPSAMICAEYRGDHQSAVCAPTRDRGRIPARGAGAKFGDSPARARVAAFYLGSVRGWRWRAATAGRGAGCAGAGCRCGPRYLPFCPTSAAEPEAEEHICTRACYRCLLSYSNQPYHAAINRHAIQSILVDLSQTQVTQNGQRAIHGSGYESVADSATSSSTALDGTALGPAGQRTGLYSHARWT